MDRDPKTTKTRLPRVRRTQAISLRHGHTLAVKKRKRYPTRSLTEAQIRALLASIETRRDDALTPARLPKAETGAPGAKGSDSVVLVLCEYYLRRTIRQSYGSRLMIIPIKNQRQPAGAIITFVPCRSKRGI